MEASGPWFRTASVKLPGVRTVPAGRNPLLQKQPRWLGREAKGIREPEAFMGWGLLPMGQGRGGQAAVWLGLQVFTQLLTQGVCKRATCRLDCEVS